LWSAVYLIKHRATTLKDLRQGFIDNEFSLDHQFTQIIGIHDGCEKGVLNRAAIINKDIFYSFICASTNRLYKTLWANDKKENPETLTNLKQLMNGQT
jgi:hypothetical protein